MANSPMSAADPSDDTDPTAGLGDPTDPGTDSGADTDSGEVLLTVMKMGDGTYKLIKGDEDDTGDTGEGASADDAAAGPDASAPAGGAGDDMTSMAGGMGGSAAPADEGQTFDSVGALLKGILDIVKEDSASDGAPGSSQSQFESGFGDDSEPTPVPAPKMAQKY